MRYSGFPSTLGPGVLGRRASERDLPMISRSGQIVAFLKHLVRAMVVTSVFSAVAPACLYAAQITIDYTTTVGNDLSLTYLTNPRWPACS